MCPICNRPDCYREITPYWRYAIEIFPDFKKEKIPVARFVCRELRRTFSLLPVQLIPYFQYTLSPWDVAAGALIVEEAGGKLTNLRGEPCDLHQPDWLATNGRVHQLVLNLDPLGPTPAA